MLFLNNNFSVIDQNFIINESKKILEKENISITKNDWKKKLNVSPNEYVSLSTYYHPNPDTYYPYIKLFVPNKDKYLISDRKYIDTVLNSIKHLSISYALTRDENYAAKCVDLINEFFINSSTHMIPRLSHSGIVMQTENTFTTHGCIIDTNNFWLLNDLINNVRKSEIWKNRIDKSIKLWFNNLADWFLCSDYGLKIQNKTNNWLSSYYLQSISYLYAADNIKESGDLLRNNFEKILSTQIDENGYQNKEILRAARIHYQNFNLHILTKIAIAGSTFGIDLWNYQDNKGRGSLYKAMLRTCEEIIEKNTFSEMGMGFHLTWLKIAHKVYKEDIFEILYNKYENKPDYYINDILKLEVN